MASHSPIIDEEGGIAANMDSILGPSEAPDCPKPGSKPSKSSTTRLSMVSQAYDEGNKGDLDKSEVKLQKYDTNNDGNLSMAEMKNIILDLQKQEKKETRWRKYTKCAVLFLVLSVICNFIGVGTA